MCAETSFVISNIVTSPLPPKIAFSLSSARIFLLFAGFFVLADFEKVKKLGNGV